MRLAICASHPIQYEAPIFRELAKSLDLHVFFAANVNPSDKSVGFSTDLRWDVDLLSGYRSSFLQNVSVNPGTSTFGGCDTPEIGSILKKGKFSVVLLLGWHIKSMHQALIAAKMLRLPVIVRGDSQLATPRSALKRIVKAVSYPVFLRCFDAALVVGQRSRKYWIHYGYPSDRIFFSPHCVDTEWFASRSSKEVGTRLRRNSNIRSDAKVILFCGKLIDKKRPLDVVDALSLMNNKEPLHFLIAGDGPLRNAIVQACRRNSIPFISLGFVNQSQMPEIYAASDLLVLPSDGRETWGLVANEALACGVPIVLSDQVGAGPDLLATASVGLRYKMGDKKELAKSIRSIIDYPPSISAIQLQSQKYSVEAACKGIIDALQSFGQ